MSYQVGDRIQVDVPEADGPDQRYHGHIGEIEEILRDDLSEITGDPRDDFLYRVRFKDESLGMMSFRHHDLRRPD